MQNYTSDKYKAHVGRIRVSKHGLHIVFPIIVAFMLLLNYFTSSDYISLACTVVVCTEIILCKQDHLLPYMIFYSLFAYLFHYNSYALYVFVCIAFLARTAFQSKKYFMLIVIFSPLYIATHMLSTSFSSISIGDLIPFFSILCLLAACLIYKPDNRENCISYFAVAYIISAIFGTMKPITRLAEVSHITYTSLYSWQDTIRFAGISYDPNFYTFLTIIILMLLFFGDMWGKHKTLFVISIITALVTGAMTYSKSFYLSFALVVIVYMLGGDKKVYKRIGYVLIAGVALSLFFENQLSRIFAIIMVRFSGAETMNDLTTGRWDLWVRYLNDIFKSFDSVLIGNGIQNYGRAAAHNTYLELLFKFGLLGTLFDMILIRICIGHIKKECSKGVIVRIGILTVFLLLLFALSAYTFPTIWPCLFMIILLLRTDSSVRDNNEIKCSNTSV